MTPEDASLTNMMDMKDEWRVSGHQPMMEKEPHTKYEATLIQHLKAQDEHISQYYVQLEFLSVLPITILSLLFLLPSLLLLVLSSSSLTTSNVLLALAVMVTALFQTI